MTRKVKDMINKIIVYFVAVVFNVVLLVLLGLGEIKIYEWGLAFFISIAMIAVYYLLNHVGKMKTSRNRWFVICLSIFILFVIATELLSRGG